ncbi:sodium channel protein type 3 subunit alpha-like isoform X3 [Clavelina lepadiformis]|uniref:sodium channel protein type 3 subunit alpha-like isoform X3 n=1 Tax=Clavelina lepadiformis TaxID=159417 RepID=UPI0040423186
MHMGFRNKAGVSDRRNAMENVLHRNSLMQGILNVTTRVGKPPTAELKEGKKLPVYLSNENSDYSIPDCCYKPLDDPDDYYGEKTYIVVNKQDTIFRFNKAKSLCLFGQNNKFRSAAVNMFVTPWFSYFVTFVILVNCICMTLVDPPIWIEDHMEYIFTTIYLFEAAVKIIAKGFMFHRFSYLRDPWNWLDFLVIIMAILSQVLRRAVSENTGKFSVLRAFRVLRAFKTMSVVPGLRAIVKALLRSIRALKDAVVLTVFCVSVFALIGYQLFHGTMRHKCVRQAGTLKLPPDSLFLYSNISTLPCNSTSNTSNMPLLFPVGKQLSLVYGEKALSSHNENQVLDTGDGKSWSNEDMVLLKTVLNIAKLSLHGSYLLQKNLSQISSMCFESKNMRLHINATSSLLNIFHKASHDYSLEDTSAETDLNFENWNCTKSNVLSNITSPPQKYPVVCTLNVVIRFSSVSCLGGFHTSTTDDDQWQEILEYGRKKVPRWNTRDFVIQFQFLSEMTNFTTNWKKSFIYFSEINWDDMEYASKEKWKNDIENYFMVEPNSGLYFYHNSSNRPALEPIYCTIAENDVCPLGYKCMEAGSNPDYDYTSFDHFFVAFLTSFRLVTLDAWNRLYYLTLHTIGPTYAIFYMLVVLLGSYYLINLILAVVYMAYEEQQAVVDEEELKAQEKEAEQRKMEEYDQESCEVCSKDEREWNKANESDIEQASVRLGLITTSLGTHYSSLSRSNMSTRRRKRLKHRRIYSKTHSPVLPVPDREDEDNKPKNRCNRVNRGSLYPASYFVSQPEERNPLSDSDGSNEGISLNNEIRYRRKKAFFRRKRNWRDENKQMQDNAQTPEIKLVVPKSPPRSLSKLVNEHGISSSNHHLKPPPSNHLSVNDDKLFFARTFSNSTQSFRDKTFSDLSSSSALEENTRNGPEQEVVRVLPIRRLSFSSSVSEENEKPVSERVVNVDVNLRVSATQPNFERSLLHLPLEKLSSKLAHNPSSPTTFAKRSPSSPRSTKSVSSCELKNTVNSNRYIAQNSVVGLRKPNGLLETQAQFENCNLLQASDEPVFCASPGENNIPDVIRRGVFLNGCGREETPLTTRDDIQILTTEIEPEIFGLPIITENHHSRKLKRKIKRPIASRLIETFIELFGKWECCPEHIFHIQTKLRSLVLNPFTDLTITLCIALNALFMSLEQHPMDERLDMALEQANLVFTIIFTVEMLTKIIGLSPYTYCREGWNVFDAIVVLFSLAELGLKAIPGLSILRAFRLLRIVKLAKQWPILNKLLRIIARTLSKLWHLTVVFLLVLYIFAVVGMQLLSAKYRAKYGDNLPRWNFIDFPHSFMVVFRIQCGEWVENMLVCLNVAHAGICIPFFILVYIVGNLVILNLFLALLLNSFSGDVLQHTTSESNSISEAMYHVRKWAKKKYKSISELRLTRYCCHLLMLGVRKSPSTAIKSNKNSIKKCSLTKLTVLSNEGTTVNEGTSENEGKSQTQVNLFNQDEIENVVNNHHLSFRYSIPTQSACPYKDKSLYSKSDVSFRSLHTMRHHSRYRHRSIREVNKLARERYRGLNNNWDSSRISTHLSYTSECSGQMLSLKGRENNNQETDRNDDNENKESVMEPCISSCPSSIFDRGPFLKLRVFMHTVIHHRYFDNLVIFCILLSSVTLALEDIHLKSRPAMKHVLNRIDIFCCIFFTIEMLMKWIGHGWKHYFTNPWCILDCIIVLISIANLTLTANSDVDFSALRALRTFRALRPLRALSRFRGMKIVVDALIRAIPSIAHVFFVCMIFWLIFSILGVNLFGGKFGRCVSLPTHDILPYRHNENESLTYSSIDIPLSLEDQCSANNTLFIMYMKKEVTRNISGLVLPAIKDKNQCTRCAQLLNTTDIAWHTPNVNFDNVLRGYLALIQVATFNGWIEVMESAVDITGENKQPNYEASNHNYLYFFVFIVFGAFFSLNLFIGVIIDNFNQQKVKSKGGEDGVFLTEEQRRYYNAMKKMASKTPSKPIPRPENEFSNRIYDIVTSRKFEIGVMTIIMLNLVVMALEHHDMSQEMSDLLGYFNLGFIGIFLVEAILKLIGLRLYYFRVPWNIFDMLVVVMSLIEKSEKDGKSGHNIRRLVIVNGEFYMAKFGTTWKWSYKAVNSFSTATGLNDVMSQYFVQPTLFRIIRLFRVTRILRLVREAKGIRTLLFALMMSLPALFNIGSLLFLLMSIYAIIGMSQFPYIQKVAGVDDLLNFETFPNAFLVLFQISTSEAWDQFIDPVLRDMPPYCELEPANGSKSNCGNSTVGSVYFITYVMTTFLIVVNMYIAIILENFEVATRENAEPLTADDFEQFFEVWQKYDDRLTQFVTYKELQHLLHHLDYPLRVSIPNTAFIAQSHMRITADGRVHCLEVIIALIRKVLGDSTELKTLKEDMMKSFSEKCKNKQEILDTGETLDAEDFTVRFHAVLVIQRAYREYRSAMWLATYA